MLNRCPIKSQQCMSPCFRDSFRLAYKLGAAPPDCSDFPTTNMLGHVPNHITESPIHRFLMRASSVSNCRPTKATANPFYHCASSRQASVMSPAPIVADPPSPRIGFVDCRGFRHQLDCARVQNLLRILETSHIDRKANEICWSGDPSSIRIHAFEPNVIGILAVLAIINHLIW